MKLYRLAVLWTFLFLAYGTMWWRLPPMSDGDAEWPICSGVALFILVVIHWAIALCTIDLTDAKP